MTIVGASRIIIEVITALISALSPWSVLSLNTTLCTILVAVLDTVTKKSDNCFIAESNCTCPEKVHIKFEGSANDEFIF